MHEITLTIGIFFDGTGNNAYNTASTLRSYFSDNHDINNVEIEPLLEGYSREHFGIAGAAAASYRGYYTNIHWLHSLYKKDININSGFYQRALYVGGVGTSAGKPDDLIAQGFGISDTGVIAKTDQAVSMLNNIIRDAIYSMQRQTPNYQIIIRALKFDLFGFSRGAAAARHFANRVQSKDQSITNAIVQGMSQVNFKDNPPWEVRFIGIFDTVAAIGTLMNGLKVNNGDTGSVNLELRPGVAKKVFHITAKNEYRLNFALNSVKPAWPEFELPGAHSDIGGGYFPLINENLFLTRPLSETVPLSQLDHHSRPFQQAIAQQRAMASYPGISTIIQTNTTAVEAWFDARMPQDRYGQMQKRTFAALTMRNRIVKNDWSRVALRVMFEAAQESGALFNPINSISNELNISPDLVPLCVNAVAMGKAIRSGQQSLGFTPNEIAFLSKEFIHCSAHWGNIPTGSDNTVQGGTFSPMAIGFVNRPDKQWKRTIYAMNGREISDNVELFQM